MARNISRRRILLGLGTGVALANTTGLSSAQSETDGDDSVSSTNPPADVTHTSVESNVGSTNSKGDEQNAEVLLIKDCNPWEITANEDVLQSLGQSYDLINADQVGDISLTAYGVVIIPSTQSNNYYSLLNNYEPEIQSFVSNGGVLLAHVAPSGWPCSGTMDDSFIPNQPEVIPGGGN